MPQNRTLKAEESRRQVGQGYPLPADYGSWGALWAPQRGPGRNAFCRILKATQRYFLHLYADALSLLVFHVTFEG